MKRKPRWLVKEWVEKRDSNGKPVCCTYSGRCLKCGEILVTESFDHESPIRELLKRFDAHYAEKHPSLLERLKAWWVK